MSPPAEIPCEAPRLSEQERSRLLGIARLAIATAVRGGGPPHVPDPGGRLSERAGVFVSLHKDGLLRGCIGQVVHPRPLYRGVLEAATSAALRDPRFPPLGKDELSSVEIEISVLSPLLEVDSSEAESQIVIGRHGLMVSKGHSRGLLLPQVAVRFGWQPREFLEETCVKAGLPRQAWLGGACLEVFTAEVFAERELPGSFRPPTAIQPDRPRKFPSGRK